LFSVLKCECAARTYSANRSKEATTATVPI